VRPLGSVEAFAPLATRIAGNALLARWPSDDYAPGEYEFVATGYDEAGNSMTASRRGNGKRLVLPSPLKVRSRIEATLDGNRARVIAGGRTAHLNGKLALDSGATGAGLVVVVVERFKRGSPAPARTTVLRTGADGHFDATLGRGPSRAVTIHFAGDPSTGRSQAGPLRLGVRPRVELEASARVAVVGGAPIAFRGALGVSRAELPAEGAAVELQFRVGGLPWSEFRTVRTDHRGRFRYRYRFSDDDSRGVRFQFRAVAPKQSDWPYEPGSSRPVAVRGA
jgi:hypothetical protein